MRGEPHDQPIHARFQRAVTDLHARCRSVCASTTSCEGRFAAVIDVLVAWTRDYPDEARLYWCDHTTSPDAELSQIVLTARTQLPRVLIRQLFRHDVTTLPETIIAFTVGIARRLIDAALHQAEPDFTHVPVQLTQLSPILKYFRCPQ